MYELKVMQRIRKGFNLLAYIPIMIFGIILLIIGIYFCTRPGVETVSCQAIITDIVSDYHAGDNTYDVFITYTDYNGVLHEHVYFNQYWFTMQVGQTIEIQLSATDPYVINPNPEIWLNILLLSGGVIFISVPVVGLIMHFKKKSIASEPSNIMPYTNNLNYEFDSLEHDLKINEGTFYFYPKGKCSNGFALSDDKHVEIYEAIPIRTAPFVTSKYIFKDIELNHEIEHKVSQTITTETSFFGEYKRNSRFKFDGINIWDYFESKGILVSISNNGITPLVEVSRNGAVISTIKGQSINEASGKHHAFGNLIRNRSFVIENISLEKELLFLICFTLTRIDLYY